jgi:hypothetical protein
LIGEQRIRRRRLHGGRVWKSGTGYRGGCYFGVSTGALRAVLELMASKATTARSKHEGKRFGGIGFEAADVLGVETRFGCASGNDGEDGHCTLNGPGKALWRYSIHGQAETALLTELTSAHEDCTVLELDRGLQLLDARQLVSFEPVRRLLESWWPGCSQWSCLSVRYVWWT